MSEHYCLHKYEETKPSVNSRVPEKTAPEKGRYPGYSFGTPLFFFRMLARNKPVPFRKWKIVLLYTLKACMMMPFSLAENLFFSRKIHATKIRESPVFIIGHYRSGTTFLHKMMSADRQWSHITTFDFLFPFHPSFVAKPLKWMLHLFIRIFRIRHPHVNRYRVNPEDPLEEDMITISSLTPQSAFWGEVFPGSAKHHFSNQVFFRNDHEKEQWKQGYLYLLKKLTRRKTGRLLLKNPPNTGRVRAILELFPHAKFIFIYRNPYQVYYSTLSLWKRTLEKHYTLQDISDEEREEIIYWHYDRLMHHYEVDRGLIPAGNLAEVRYETFEKDPFGEVKRIYQELGLPGFDQAEGEFRKQLEREKKYRKYSYTYDGKTQDRIYEHWGYFIEKWQYDRL